MMDGTPVNVDVTAPGAIIALALMFLKVIATVRLNHVIFPWKLESVLSCEIY